MWNWIGRIAELQRSARPFTLVTVTRCSGSTPCAPGTKMIVLQDGTFSGTIGGGHLEKLAIGDALACLREGTSRTQAYPLGAKVGQCCGGTVEVFMEVLGNGPLLYLFGAGHVGQAVARTLAGTAFQVHLVDEREEWIRSEQLPSETIRHACEWSDFARDAIWDSTRVYVGIMTFRHDMDQDILADLLRRPVRYLGLIGSESKWERFKQRLTARGFKPEELSKVTCPIGLNAGAGKAPQEIAISFAAQLLSLHYGLSPPG